MSPSEFREFRSRLGMQIGAIEATPETTTTPEHNPAAIRTRDEDTHPLYAAPGSLGMYHGESQGAVGVGDESDATHPELDTVIDIWESTTGSLLSRTSRGELKRRAGRLAKFPRALLEHAALESLQCDGSGRLVLSDWASRSDDLANAITLALPLIREAENALGEKLYAPRAIHLSTHPAARRLLEQPSEERHRAVNELRSADLLLDGSGRVDLDAWLRASEHPRSAVPDQPTRSDLAQVQEYGYYPAEADFAESEYDAVWPDDRPDSSMDHDRSAGDEGSDTVSEWWSEYHRDD